MASEADNGGNDVEFMNLVVDKADNLRVTDSDSHFSDFAGVHPSKIKQGKLFLHDIIKPSDREEIMHVLCKKNSPYVYFNAEFKGKDGSSVLMRCTGQNFEGSTLCRLTLADVSKLQKKQEDLQQQARKMNYLIDLVTGGVCLFKVTADMHIVVTYLNEGGCRLFGTTKEMVQRNTPYRLDELIHPDDKSLVFQAIGKAMATDGQIDIEFRTIVHKDEFRWCKFNAAIQQYDEEKNPVFHAMFSDITSVKKAEEKADRMSESLVTMFKNLPDPIFCTDIQNLFKLQIVSEDFIKFLGYSRAELFENHGGDLADFISEREYKMITASIRKQLEQGNEAKVHYRIRSKGGKYYIVEDRRKAVLQDDGSYSLICRLKNITSKYKNQDIDIN